jgi:hypothetical protein
MRQKYSYDLSPVPIDTISFIGYGSLLARNTGTVQPRLEGGLWF